ncbi:MAG: hypothetical protein JOZ44_14130 [Acidobacteria bacterium]|nr:hypothetical protein [Acidobacteriota bacterium]
MKAALVFSVLLLLGAASAQAQQNNEPRPNGLIRGILIDQGGQPAKQIGLTAEPVGVPLAAALPHTKTNDAGEYRFENISWSEKFTVYADDEEAGYDSFSTGPAGPQGKSKTPEVELTPEHPEAELKVLLPPRAGFVHIHLTNRKTGSDIRTMRVALMLQENPTSPVLTMSCDSNHTILIPPEKNLLLHITSDGFRSGAKVWEKDCRYV